MLWSRAPKSAPASAFTSNPDLTSPPLLDTSGGGPGLLFQTEKPTDGEEASVGDHAVIRSDCLALDMPATMQDFDRAGVDPLAAQGFSNL
jgi:hypothetical protein